MLHPLHKLRPRFQLTTLPSMCSTNFKWTSSLPVVGLGLVLGLPAIDDEVVGLGLLGLPGHHADVVLVLPIP